MFKIFQENFNMFQENFLKNLNNFKLIYMEL